MVWAHTMACLRGVTKSSYYIAAIAWQLSLYLDLSSTNKPKW